MPGSSSASGVSESTLSERDLIKRENGISMQTDPLSAFLPPLPRKHPSTILPLIIPNGTNGYSYIRSAADRPAFKLKLVKTKLTPPRELTDTQRVELMAPGFLWKYQCSKFVSCQPDNADVVSQYGEAFMASSVEVLDDLEQAAAERLIHEVGAIAGYVLAPFEAVEDDVRMLAFDMWLCQLLESGYLVLYADTLFAGALTGWNEAILSNTANRRRFAALLRPAEHHARGIMRRFQERGFYKEVKAC